MITLPVRQPSRLVLIAGVQIWFQNRRQNDRRKSRPLSAQEIAALRYGGMQILSSDPVAYTSSLPEEKTSPVVETAPVNAVMPAETPVKAIRLRGDETDEQPQQATPSILSGGPEATASETPLSQVTASSSQPHSTGSFSFSNSVGFFTSSHWNPSSAFSTPSTLNRSVDETPKYVSLYSFSTVFVLTNYADPICLHLRLAHRLHMDHKLYPLLNRRSNHKCGCRFLWKAKLSLSLMRTRPLAFSLRSCFRIWQPYLSPK